MATVNERIKNKRRKKPMPQVTEKPSLDIVPTAPAPLELTQPEEIKLEFADEQNFDYSTYPEEFKLKSYERKARIKTNEQVANKAFYDIAQDVKAQHDDLVKENQTIRGLTPYQQWLEWCSFELHYKKDMACELKIIAENLVGHVRLEQMPTSFRALRAFARIVRDTDDSTKQEILDQVQQKTEEKGKPLTEKEIKELPLVKQLQAEKEALKAEKKKIEEEKNQMEENLFSLEFEKTTWDEEQKKISRRAEILANQAENNMKEAKQIKEEYLKKQQQLEKKEKSIDDQIKKKEDILRQNLTQELKDKKIQEIEQEKERLEKEKKELERKVKLAKDQVEHFEMLEAQREARKPQVLDDIFELFEQIERTIVGESDLILSPPSPEYVVRYKLLVDKLKSTTNALEKVLDMVSSHEENIIEVEGKQH